MLLIQKIIITCILIIQSILQLILIQSFIIYTSNKKIFIFKLKQIKVLTFWDTLK